jgi:hypothetical protein
MAYVPHKAAVGIEVVDQACFHWRTKSYLNFFSLPHNWLRPETHPLTKHFSKLLSEIVSIV